MTRESKTYTDLWNMTGPTRITLEEPARTYMVPANARQSVGTRLDVDRADTGDEIRRARGLCRPARSGLSKFERRRTRANRPCHERSSCPSDTQTTRPLRHRSQQRPSSFWCSCLPATNTESCGVRYRTAPVSFQRWALRLTHTSPSHRPGLPRRRGSHSEHL